MHRTLDLEETFMLILLAPPVRAEGSKFQRREVTCFRSHSRLDILAIWTRHLIANCLTPGLQSEEIMINWSGAGLHHF